MANFAIKAPDGTIENIVVADRASDVAVPAGRSILPVGSNAEIGGTHDGTMFVKKPRPAPEPREEPKAHRALRALADEIGPSAAARIVAILGPAPN